MKLLIVGGVAGGASTAARLRRLDEKAEIIIFERGEYISFANCGLPYYIGGVISERNNLLVVEPSLMKSRFNIDVRVFNEVVKIDRDKKILTIVDLQKDIKYTETYDKLVLSPGATPLVPPIPGIHSKKIFTLRNIPDTDAIVEAINDESVKRAVVVGGGFIGLEMVENLTEKGIKVSLVEMAPQVMAPLDFEMAAIVHQHLQVKNIEFYLNDGVQAFQDTEKGINVILSSRRTIEADLVILAIGVKPETSLALEAGIECNRGIVVNKNMRTSDENIFAVGDAVEVRDFISGKPTLIPLAWPANKQGRIAADNIAGIPSEYKGTQGTAIAKLFDLTIASTGLNEKQLKAQSISYLKSFTHSANHAGYYPGAIPMSIKIIFAPDTGKLLGGQIVGIKGVDKRIDVLATAIRAGMTVYDLEELELAYAPPYSSAKDPVIMAGFVAVNILNKQVKIIHWDEISDSQNNGNIIIDVRTEEEYSLGAMPGAINIPLDELRNRSTELSKDKKLYVYCQMGLRGYVAARILSQWGYDVYNLSGGYITWHFTTLKQANEDIYDSNKITLNDEIVAVGEHESHGQADLKIDACGLQCPGPIMQLHKGIKKLNPNQHLDIEATDPGFWNDISTWCERTGNTLVSRKSDGGVIKVRIKKAAYEKSPQGTPSSNGKTLVLFSGDFDKAMAAMIIANTAASMGKEVSIFFTFWGLNLLRKNSSSKVKKNIVEKLFGIMMPRGAENFKLSKMNMMGMGTAMMKGIMNKKNVTSLKELLAAALANGVKFIACQMTMDIMGIKKEELIDGIEIGGAATYVGTTDHAGTNLFI
ncbi:MAG: FAD-dependent oxidoreductase [Spirochaetales bacterium]|nr:FAD-dependent oxidoreductase [Spirochaetales bacterium]